LLKGVILADLSFCYSTFFFIYLIYFFYFFPTSKREERIYAVAPCPYPRFYEHFFKVVRNSISEGIVLRPLPVHFIIQGEGTALKIADIVGNYLTIGEGGIRCATNMAPQKSIFSERLLPSPTSTLTLFSPSPLEPEE
jgi:hypothetical protein